MRLANLTNLPVKPLIKFVEKHFDFSAKTQLFVDTTTQTDRYGGARCGGLASSDDKVYVTMNPAATYPRTQRLNLRTPEVRFESWQDEFVMVLAHELRHIDQFALGAFPVGQELEAEVDAETYAASVLERFKRNFKTPLDGSGSSKVHLNL
jgi:hypothetical protein